MYFIKNANFFLILICVWIIPLDVIAQDTMEIKRHKIYVEVPVFQSYYLTSQYGNFPRALYVSRLGLAYNYQFKKGGEACVSLFYNFRRSMFNYYYPQYYNLKQGYRPLKDGLPYSIPSYNLRLQIEKRWFLLKKYQFQPWCGIFIPINFSSHKGEKFIYTDSFGNTSNFESSTQIISSGFGFNFGLRYSYKGLSVISYIQSINLPFQKSYTDIGLKATQDGYLTEIVGFMFGYSF
jgi:hypothetical protein